MVQYLYMIPINPMALCHLKLWHLKDKLWKAARRSLSEKDVWCSGSFGTGLKFCTCPPIDRLGLLHVSSTWISADFSDWVVHRTQGTWPCVTLEIKSIGEHNFCLFLWNIHDEALNCHIRNLPYVSHAVRAPLAPMERPQREILRPHEGRA